MKSSGGDLEQINYLYFYVVVFLYVVYYLQRIRVVLIFVLDIRLYIY